VFRAKHDRISRSHVFGLKRLVPKIEQTDVNVFYLFNSQIFEVGVVVLFDILQEV
jgi:hypothetical protein